MESRGRRSRLGSRRALACLASIAVVAFLGSADVAAADAAGQGSEHPPRLVLNPRQGEVIRSNHVTIRVRSRDLSGVLRARLNGVDVGGEFGRARKGKRSLRTSVSHGLHHGRNVLKVRVRRRDKPTRRTKISFTVRRHRPLVGAGRDRSVVIHSRSQLRGRVKRAPNGPPRGHVRWQLIDGPRGARGVAPRANGIRAKLSFAAGRRSGFRPSVPGTYTVQLRHGSGRTAIRDRAKVYALRPSPLVPVDTYARERFGNLLGIRVGGTLYSPNGTYDGAGVQVLVLERQTLGFVSNQQFSPIGDSDRLLRFIGSLGNDKLVIVASWGGAADQDLPITRLLQRIGVPALCNLGPLACDAIPHRGHSPRSASPGWQRMKPTGTSSTSRTSLPSPEPTAG